MRVTLSVAGIALLLAAAAGHAQTVPYKAAIGVPEAEVRSGPGTDPKLYATNKLPQGTVVEVVKAIGPTAGWRSGRRRIRLAAR